MGYEPLTKFVVFGVVALQFAAAYYLRHTSVLSPRFLLLAYAVGGTANHNLFLAIHEITHNLAFKGIRANKALAIFANLPIGVPYAAAFKVILVSRLCVTPFELTSFSGIPYRASQVSWRGWNRYRYTLETGVIMS